MPLGIFPARGADEARQCQCPARIAHPRRCARNRIQRRTYPETPRGFELQFLGFICLADPLRSDVPPALAECKQAGIRVVMITGDHPGTAVAIATQAGFDVGAGVLTGAEARLSG